LQIIPHLCNAVKISIPAINMSKRVAIIGAGPAGLTAAYLLGK